jgi:hypothetical protein
MNCQTLTAHFVIDLNLCMCVCECVEDYESSKCTIKTQPDFKQIKKSFLTQLFF